MESSANTFAILFKSPAHPRILKSTTGTCVLEHLVLQLYGGYRGIMLAVLHDAIWRPLYLTPLGGTEL